MTILDFCQKLQLEVVAAAEPQEVQGIFCGDLVSWILANAQAGDALCSVNVNDNMLAAAKKLGLACVIACHGSPCASVRKTALEQGVWLLRTGQPMAQFVKQAWEALQE